MIFTDEQKTKLAEIKKRYSLKNIKTFMVMDTYGVNATVYRDGVKLGVAIDDGGEGEMYFQPRNVIDIIEYDVKDIGKVKYDGFDGELNYEANMLINQLINEILEKKEEEKKLKKWCKTKTIIITTDCKPGQYLTYNFPYKKELKRQLEVKHNNLVEIINERFAK